MNTIKTIKFTCDSCHQHLETDSDKADTDLKCPACGNQCRIPTTSEVRIWKPETRNFKLVFRRCFLIYAAIVMLYFIMPFHLILPFEVEQAPISELWDQWKAYDFGKWWSNSSQRIGDEASTYVRKSKEEAKRPGSMIYGISDYDRWSAIYKFQMERFMSEGGRVYWSFPAYFVAKKGIPITVLLGVPFLIYFAVLWVINGLKINETINIPKE